jgi:hypothetical protein
VDGLAAHGEHRQNVGLERVANHQKCGGVHAVAGEHALVGGGVLLAHNLDPGKKIAQARACQFAFLVEEVALGEHHQAVAAPLQFRQHLDYAGQGLDGKVEQALAQVEQLLDFAARHGPIGELDGGFGHGQHQGLGAVAVQVHVVALHLVEVRADGGGVAAVGQDAAHFALHVVEVRLVGPQRIVGVEGNELGVAGEHGLRQKTGGLNVAGPASPKITELAAHAPPPRPGHLAPPRAFRVLFPV